MKRLLLILLVCALAPVAARAATATTIKRLPTHPRAAPDGQRFLFVVDISSAMRASDAENRQALFDTIFNGIDGQMRTGDTFGLWLFNDELRAGEFPLQVWDEKNSMETASLAAKFLREQKYSGRPKPGAFMPRLLNLMKNVGDVSVLIFSDGGAQIEGTPFDAKIAAVYERRKSERSKAQKPFVTLLVARGGAIVSGAVVIAGESLGLPERAAPAVPLAATNRVATPTNTAALAVAAVRTPPPAPAVVEVGEPKTIESLNVQSNPPVAPPMPKVIQIVTHSNVARANPPVEPPPARTNSVVAPPTPPVTVATPALPSVVQDTQPVSPSILPVAAREPVVPVPPDAQPISPEPPAVQATAAPVPLPASDSNSTLLIVMGGVLMAACLGLLAVVLRRTRPAQRTSVITQSMERR